MKEQKSITPGRWLKGLMLKHMHGMITCVEFEDFILRYLDDELPTRQKTIFEWHMRLCAECREYLAAYRRSMEIGKRIHNDTYAAAPEDVPEDLIKAVLESLKKD